MLKISEQFEEFKNSCGYYVKNGTAHCTHKNKSIDICIDKKYCPRIEKPRQKAALTGWKADFNVYLQEHDKFYNAVIQSFSFRKPLEDQFPDIDIERTLQEAMFFWTKSDGEGWKRKVKAGTDKIDWEATYTNNVKMKVARGFAIKKPMAKKGGW